MKFLESSIVEIYKKDLADSGLAAFNEDIESAFKIIFLAHAIHLKKAISTVRPNNKKNNLIVITTKLPKSGDCFYGKIERIVHGDEDNTIPDSYELSFNFNDDSTVKNADAVLTTGDPDFMTTVHTTARTMNMALSSDPLSYNFISFTTIEALNKFIRQVVSSGEDANVEFDGIFTLDIVNGEEPKIIILPGSDLKASIKSDDAVQVSSDEE